MLSLPSLPFSCAFDILFRYEAMDHIESVLGPIMSHHRWSEIMSACCIVRRLAHPAHALLLLRPPESRIPDSMSAWSVSHQMTGFRPPMTLSHGVLIRAMKVFLDDRSEPFEWMDASFIKHQTLPLSEWAELARQTVSNYHFEARWWKAWRAESLSIRGEVDESVTWIGTATAQLATGEKETLLDALRKEETDKVLKAKIEQKKAIAAKRPANKPPLPPRITAVDAECIESVALKRRDTHLRVLRDVEATLRDMRVFSDQFPRVASLIVRLGYEYPRIRWSLRLVLHEVAIDVEDMPVWRALKAMAWRAVDADPLGALVAMGK